MNDLATTLPESWAEVPFGLYCRYAAATDLPGRLSAFAALIGLAPEALLGNVRTYFLAKADLPWLDTLPQGPAPATFTHQGTAYQSVGHLETLNAGQLEALLATMAAHEAAPALAGPELLALLYAPVGGTQTLATVQAAAAAFDTLPMAVAWPALQGFIGASGPSALIFQQYSAARSHTLHLLTTLDNSLPAPTASPGFSSKLLSAAGRAWIRSARKTLGAS